MLKKKTRTITRYTTRAAVLSTLLAASISLPVMAHEGGVHCEKTVLGAIKQHIKKSHQAYRLECE